MTNPDQDSDDPNYNASINESSLNAYILKDVNIGKVILEGEFLKHGGGLFKNEKQKRFLKLHQSGEISYWKKGKMRGVIILNSQSSCEMQGSNQFFITFIDHKTKEER